MPTAVETGLAGLRVLVVEDTLLIADMISSELTELGCIIVGPVSRVDRGLALAAKETLDGALLDINLAGEFCYPIVEVLRQRGVPVGFLTGYEDTVLPAAYRAMPRLAKPFRLGQLIGFVKDNFAIATV